MDKLTPSGSVPGKLYGRIKVHKTEAIYKEELFLQ